GGRWVLRQCAFGRDRLDEVPRRSDRYMRLPMEVPAAAGKERRPYLGCLDCTACSRANCSARALFRMSAHSCEPILKASSIAVSPSPLTVLTSAPFLSSRSTIFASPRVAAYMSGV